MNNNDILSMIEDPEIEDDELDDFDEKKSILFDSKELIDSIGKEFIISSKFEDSYMQYMGRVISINNSDQQEICNRILEQTCNNFEFQFSKKFELLVQEDFDNVYKFIYFIHSSFSDYIHIILEEINYLIVLENNLSNLKNLKALIGNETLYEKCSIIVDKLISKKDKLIKDFLIYCNDDIIYEIITIHVERNVTEISANILSERGM